MSFLHRLVRSPDMNPFFQGSLKPGITIIWELFLLRVMSQRPQDQRPSDHITSLYYRKTYKLKLGTRVAFVTNKISSP